MIPQCEFLLYPTGVCTLNGRQCFCDPAQTLAYLTCTRRTWRLLAIEKDKGVKSLIQPIEIEPEGTAKAFPDV